MNLAFRTHHIRARLLRPVLPALLALAVVPALAAAQTTRVLDSPGSEVNADTTIRDGGYAGVNYSTSAVLESKRSSAGYSRRILLKFDTQNLIPAGAVINSARLTLVLKATEGGDPRPISAYRVKRAFTGSQTNWLDARDDTRWTSNGGDIAERYASTTVGTSIGGAYSFDLTQLVQRSVNGDFGSRYTRVALIDTGSASSSSYRSFHSSRSSTTAVRPKLVISYGTASTTTTTSTTGTTLKVMEWNIHKTKGTDGKCNADRIATWVQKLGAHVVSLNEVNYYSGECSYTADQSATLEALVEKKTGQTWYRKFLNSFGGDRGVGNLILSRFPFASSAGHLLSYDRGIVQARIVVNGRNINVFSTHVDYDHASWRTIQTNQVKSWAANFSAPRIVMGDFNTRPGSTDYDIMANAYTDAWVEAKRLGTATAYNGTGATHGDSRFDYVYYTKNAGIVLKSVNVASTSSSGVYASDHDPVIAVFTVQ